METLTQKLLLILIGIGSFNIIFHFLEIIQNIIRIIKNKKKKVDK